MLRETQQPPGDAARSDTLRDPNDPVRPAREGASSHIQRSVEASLACRSAGVIRSSQGGPSARRSLASLDFHWNSGSSRRCWAYRGRNSSFAARNSSSAVRISSSTVFSSAASEDVAPTSLLYFSCALRRRRPACLSRSCSIADPASRAASALMSLSIAGLGAAIQRLLERRAASKRISFQSRRLP